MALAEDKYITYGIHCKACDAMLGADDLDPELCHTCLGVVHTTNKYLYESVFKAEEEAALKEK